MDAISTKPCGGGPPDERHQRGSDYCDWRMESESVLERGDHTGKYRTHCFVPCNKAVPEKEIGQ
eukprot:15966831-Heterocapsa_arctica.AAC.1